MNIGFTTSLSSQEDKAKSLLTVVSVGKRLEKPNPLGFIPEVVETSVPEKPTSSIATPSVPIKVEKPDGPDTKTDAQPEEPKPQKPSPTKRTISRRIKMDEE